MQARREADQASPLISSFETVAGSLEVRGTTPVSAKGRRTRQRLLEAARTVFERDGFLAARVADIAAEAGVSHGTFYTYFDSKTEIFRVLIADVMAMVYDTRDPPEESEDLTPFQRIERGNRQFVHVYRENGAMFALMEHAVAYDVEVRQIRRRVRQVSVDRIRSSIERLQEEGVVRTDLDARCSASALVSMVNNFVYFWLVMDEGEYDDDMAVYTLTQLWVSALQMKLD
jgi:AcrR family transcriptional regulator